MIQGLVAEIVLAVHFAVVAFALAGGLAVVRWPRLARLHLPAVAWATVVNLCGWTCPLTPLEVGLRRAAGQPGYAGGFLEHYLDPILYPAGMTRPVALLAAVALPLWTAGVYLWVWRTRARRLSGPEGPG